MAFLGKEQVRLARSGEVRYTVARIEKGWALISRQLRIWAQSQRLVVAKVTAVLQVSAGTIRQNI